MLSTSLLAWLYWDPMPEAFTIPFFGRPVAWYGICFVTGFILGYFVLQPIFRKFLWGSKRLLERDILSWSKLAELLNNGQELSQAVMEQLKPKVRSELLNSVKNQDLSPSLKQELLTAFSSLLEKPGTNVTRKTLEHSFAGAIANVRDLSILFTDRLTWFIVLGTIVGARLGHVLFYDFPSYARNPVDILKIWEGGLASHGGTLGVIISIALFLYLYRKSLPELSFIKLIDMIVIPTALAACFIRIGNFINQEILGSPTTLPWGVVFGHPADRSFPEPRHPVSLYEGLCYLCIFVILYSLWKFGRSRLKQGFLSGLFFVLVFGSRFLIDFLKLPQSQMIDESFLQMGQYLSLPFIFLGMVLMFTSERKLSLAQRACNL